MMAYIRCAIAEFAGAKSITTKEDKGIKLFIMWNLVMGILNIIGCCSIFAWGVGLYGLPCVIFMIGNFYLYTQGRGAEGLFLRKANLKKAGVV